MRPATRPVPCILAALVLGAAVLPLIAASGGTASAQSRPGPLGPAQIVGPSRAVSPRSVIVTRGGSRTASAGAPVQCEKCHADRVFLAGKARNALGDSVLFVPDSFLTDSRHRTLRCADCHSGYNDGYPHATVRAIAAPCQECHEDQGTAWSGSVHSKNFEKEGQAPTCVSCHSAHRVLGADDERSSTYPLNVARLCGSCHNAPRILDAYFKKPADTTARTAVGDYKRSVHGLAMTKAGLVISATCSDCHGAHRVLPRDSTASSLGRVNVAATCGQCHVGVRTTFDSSAHGRALVSGDTTESGHRAPVCVDCHGGHTVVEASDPVWFRGVVQECGACHGRLLETYDETYHGKATELGHGIAAKCSDCHTPHAMLAADDPRSTVNRANVVETCRQCHPAANAGFAEFRPHGDPRDRKRDPELFWVWLTMTTLLGGVFTFFGAHTLLWFARVTLDRRRAARRDAEPPPEPDSPSAPEDPHEPRTPGEGDRP